MAASELYTKVKKNSVVIFLVLAHRLNVRLVKYLQMSVLILNRRGDCWVFAAENCFFLTRSSVVVSAKWMKMGLKPHKTCAVWCSRCFKYRCRRWNGCSWLKRKRCASVFSSQPLVISSHVKQNQVYLYYLFFFVISHIVWWAKQGVCFSRPLDANGLRWCKGGASHHGGSGFTILNHNIWL